MSFATQSTYEPARLRRPLVGQAGETEEQAVETVVQQAKAHPEAHVRPVLQGESSVLRLLANGPSTVNSPAQRTSLEDRDADQPASRRALLTLLFTDIVASTEALERLGDRAWCVLLLRHHAIVRHALEVYGGTEVDAAGDGFFVTFDRPSAALRFAAAVRANLKETGLAIRMGLHAGECELVEKLVEGVAVHTAARVASLAHGGEILVSDTVRDLLAGSEWKFSKKAMQTLKGLSEPRVLFALEFQ
jgi:class 3 adenylate cyclase